MFFVFDRKDLFLVRLYFSNRYHQNYQQFQFMATFDKSKNTIVV